MRTVLYADPQIADYFRNNTILHWHATRPVPKVTIDFGDGRKLERTITGNSAHLLLDADGRPFDVLPGMTSPSGFLTWLQSAIPVATTQTALDSDQRNQARIDYHAAALRTSHREMMNDLASIQHPKAGADVPIQALNKKSPTAKQATRRAVGKSMVELPIVNEIAMVPNSERIVSELDSDTWRALAALHRDSVRLSSSARSVIQSHHAREALAITASKDRIESPLLGMIRTFEENIGVDTVRGRYDFHQTIHRWFINDLAPANVSDLSDKLFAEIFLTPKTDPWLGLVPTDGYTGLDEGGLSSN